MLTLPRFRSLLFVRADDAAALERARASVADAVVADLEDSTPADAKALARDVLTDVWREPSPGLARLVRVNELEGSLADDDLALVAGLALDGLVVPQASIETIDAAAAAAGLPVVAVIESARGLREAYELASRPHVDALALGAKDLSSISDSSHARTRTNCSMRAGRSSPTASRPACQACSTASSPTPTRPGPRIQPLAAHSGFAGRARFGRSTLRRSTLPSRTSS